MVYQVLNGLHRLVNTLGVCDVAVFIKRDIKITAN